MEQLDGVTEIHQNYGHILLILLLTMTADVISAPKATYSQMQDAQLQRPLCQTNDSRCIEVPQQIQKTLLEPKIQGNVLTVINVSEEKYFVRQLNREVATPEYLLPAFYHYARNERNAKFRRLSVIKSQSYDMQTDLKSLRLENLSDASYLSTYSTKETSNVHTMLNDNHKSLMPIKNEILEPFANGEQKRGVTRRLLRLKRQVNKGPGKEAPPTLPVINENGPEGMERPPEPTRPPLEWGKKNEILHCIDCYQDAFRQALNSPPFPNYKKLKNALQFLNTSDARLFAEIQTTVMTCVKQGLDFTFSRRRKRSPTLPVSIRRRIISEFRGPWSSRHVTRSKKHHPLDSDIWNQIREANGPWKDTIDVSIPTEGKVRHLFGRYPVHAFSPWAKSRSVLTSFGKEIMVKHSNLRPSRLHLASSNSHYSRVPSTILQNPRGLHTSDTYRPRFSSLHRSDGRLAQLQDRSQLEEFSLPNRSRRSAKGQTERWVILSNKNSENMLRNLRKKVHQKKPWDVFAVLEVCAGKRGIRPLKSLKPKTVATGKSTATEKSRKFKTTITQTTASPAIKTVSPKLTAVTRTTTALRTTETTPRRKQTQSHTSAATLIVSALITSKLVTSTGSTTTSLPSTMPASKVSRATTTTLTTLILITSSENIKTEQTYWEHMSVTTAMQTSSKRALSTTPKSSSAMAYVPQSGQIGSNTDVGPSKYLTTASPVIRYTAIKKSSRISAATNPIYDSVSRKFNTTSSSVTTTATTETAPESFTTESTTGNPTPLFSVTSFLVTAATNTTPMTPHNLQQSASPSMLSPVAAQTITAPTTKLITPSKKPNTTLTMAASQRDASTSFSTPVATLRKTLENRAPYSLPSTSATTSLFLTIMASNVPSSSYSSTMIQDLAISSGKTSTAKSRSQSAYDFTNIVRNAMQDLSTTVPVQPQAPSLPTSLVTASVIMLGDTNGESSSNIRSLDHLEGYIIVFVLARLLII